MSRRRIGALLATALLSVGIGLAGCGGGSDEKKGEEAERSGEPEGGEEAENAQAEALSKVPTADRIAFFQLSTAIGTLRARAAPVAVGSTARLSSAAGLRAARAQVAALRPEDSQLTRLRSRLIPVLDSFAKAPVSGGAARQAAQRAISQADQIEAGLRTYAQRIPAIGGAIPD